jgi:hypothetical protein
VNRFWRFRRYSAQMIPSTNRILITTGWLATVGAALWAGKTYLAPGANGAALATTGPRGHVVAVSASDQVVAATGATAAEKEAIYRIIDVNSATVKAAMDSSKSPAERIKALNDIKDPVERMEAWLALIKSLKTSDEMGNAVSGLLENFDFRSRSREMTMVLSRWTALDPQAAAQMAIGIKDGRVQGMATQLVVRDWAEKDPQAALLWAQGQAPKPKEEGGERDGNWHLMGWIQSVSKTNPEWASQIAQSEPRSEARGEMMDSLISGFMNRDGKESTQRWTSSLPDGVFKDGVTRRLASRLADNDPAKAAEWVLTLPNGTKSGAFNEVIDEWADRDTNGAAEFLGRFAPSPETDDARMVVAREALRQDPESAMAWVGTISNQNYRSKALRDMFRDWRRRDEKAALGWLSRSGQPKEVQEQMIR